ncbi:hypothetical protein DV735_g1631, partial [Chaetothyriales sp. CBS 134920]
MASDQPSITRLHISPLTPDLLLAVLGPQRLEVASNIAFHSIQTAPDRPFGYVDLPSMEADKVKKKLHGAILKGKKMKVEDARPKKRSFTDVEDDPTAEAPSDLSQTRGREKRTADKGSLAGHELSPERKTVHEFERNTVEPTFLKTEKAKARSADLHFVDGQGWIDGEGNVVEKEPTNLLQRRKAKHNEPQVHPLEAIFKKPQKPASAKDVVQPSLEVQTSFSFFAGIADDDLEDEPLEPLTPFTSQEMRVRGHRSAAPTPDTARPSRFNSYSSFARSTDEGSQSSQDEESPFAKAFWEQRGDNNRAWKARRRTVLKERRQLSRRHVQTSAALYPYQAVNYPNAAQAPAEEPYQVQKWLFSVQDSAHQGELLGRITCLRREIQCDFELTPANSISPCKTTAAQDEKPIPSTSSANGSNASPILPRVNPFDAPDLVSVRKTTDLAISDLKLLHHYTTHIAPELASPRRPESLVMWQVHCVQLGFKYDFLLRGLLAVAAFEMCQSHPDQRAEYEVIASHHQSLALASYRETLQDVNASNCHAVFAFACVLIVMAFASSPKEQPSDFNSDVLHWFHLLRGANMVLNMHADNIRSSFLKPLITEMDTVKTTPTYTIPNTDRISDLFRICRLSNHEREVAQTYTLSIHSLLSTFTQVSICRNSNESPVLASFVWPITLPPHFLDLLGEKQPEALVILAHYCVVIYWGERDNTWFLRGWASYMLETIKRSIPGSWLEHLKWPDEMIK